MTDTNKTKQVIVVRTDLNMRKGKIGAQVAHASMQALLNYANWDSENSIKISMPEPMVDWLKGSFTKIVVSVKSEDELIEIYFKAKEKNIPCSLIVDAGLTEFHGVPTKTAVAIGPDISKTINEITGHLSLL